MKTRVINGFKTVISFIIYAVLNFILGYIITTAFGLNEKISTNLIILLSLFGTAFISVLLHKSKKIVLKSIVAFISIELFLLIFEPLHSIVPDQILSKTQIVVDAKSSLIQNEKVEILRAERSFGGNVDTSKVKVVFIGKLKLFRKINNLLNRSCAMAWGNTIYINYEYTNEQVKCFDSSVAVHEFVHIWQDQQGIGSGPRWIFGWVVYYWTQITDQDSLYSYGDKEGLLKAKSEGKVFRDFSIEQQANIAQYYYYFTFLYRLYDVEYYSLLKYYATEEFTFNSPYAGGFDL